MPIAQSCRDYFSNATRSKGESYFQRRHVKIKSSEAERLTANVSGTDPRPYVVTLEQDADPSSLYVECSCPHYDEGNFCKHIWATMLAGEMAGSALLAAGRRDCELLHRDDRDVDGEDFDDDDAESFVLAPRAGWQRPYAGREKAPTKRGTPTGWLGELAKLPALSGTGRQITGAVGVRQRGEARAHFIIDVGASAATDALIVNLYQQQPLKDGQWGKIKALKAHRDELDGFAPGDRNALELAMGNEARAPWSYSFGAHAPIEQLRVARAMYDVVLPTLCATGRCAWFLAADVPAESAQPLDWDAGEPWRFQLVVDDSKRPKGWIVRGHFMRGEERLASTDAVLALSSGLVLFPDRLARLVPPADWRWLQLIRKRSEVAVPAADRDALLASLWGGGETSAVVWPPSLAIAVERPAPRGVLQVHAAPNARKLPPYHKNDKFYATVKFDYAGRHADLDAASTALVVPGGEQILLRDAAAERRLTARLDELRLRAKERTFYYDPPGDVQFPKTRLHEIVAALIAEDWYVEAEGCAIRQPGKFCASISSGVDWFDLETAIDFDGVVASLPQLLASLKRGEKYVQLDDGSQGLLPDEWLERYAPLAELATVEGEALRFRPSQALLIDALLADRGDDVLVAVDRQFRRVRDKLRSFAGVPPREAPAGFRGDLRPYQKQGLGWLAFLADFGLGGCLADDMGLGKTVQVLAWLVARRRSRRRDEEQRASLVICPKSVVFNWQLEAERFAPKLATLNYTGLGRRGLVDAIDDADLVLTTYGTLRKDIEALKDVPFDYVILDEAQAIKNDQSVSAKACRLLQSRHRLALTGTPVENHLGDLWSLFEFLNPGMLGRSAALQAFTRLAAIASDAPDDRTAAERDAALGTLRRGLAPFILRRTKAQVLSDLPEKSEQTMHVDLLPADRKRYNELRDHYRQSLMKRVSDAGMNAARMHVLEALLRLRQTACHAGLVDKALATKPSAKVELLLEQLAEVVDEGHKALVFSQFTSLLAIVRRELDARGVAYEYLDGRTRKRAERVTRFQTDAACPLFLISLKAGGTGLNLTAADYVFLLDPWWNPAVEAQAIDRAHRIGQERRVFAYRLVARDTVEEKILDLQRRKRDLADAIISADGGALSSLSAQDLEMLLS